MNKNDLIEALVPRLGDRAAAGLAVEALVDVVLREVAAGGSVGITGFGTFEPVERAARTGRNPHTGEAVPIGATRSPRFRPGTYFKAVVSDPDRLPGDGLAGARVGSSEDRGSGTGQRGSAARTSSSASAGHGAPATIRRSPGTGADGGAGSSARPEDADEAAVKEQEKQSRGRRRSGTPATVRADRPAPAPTSASEPARQRGTGGRMSIGGEQITRDMISAKKAQLARAKDDHVAEKAARKAKGQAGENPPDTKGKKTRRDKKAVKDKKKAKTKKAGKKS